MYARRLTVLLATALLAGTLTACGSADDKAGGAPAAATSKPAASGQAPAAGGDSRHACDLITDAEAAQALGRSTPSKPYSDVPKTCEYRLDDVNTDGGYSWVDVKAYPGNPYDDETKARNADWVAKGIVAAVPGLGDGATIQKGVYVTTIVVWYKGYSLGVDVQRLDSTPTEPLAMAIAKNAVARF
jgi:hypothetical protein